jgi:hypothetical protein
MQRRTLTRLALAAAILVPVAGAVAGSTPAAHADGPGVGTPWIVSLGDSAISGEAGRWAGNTNGSSGNVDALGPTAYFDNSTNTAETITDCHRSHAAEVFIGGGVNGANLACSGATTSTHFDSSSNDFKPGIDFYSDANGNIGQALALQNFAAAHNVKAVVVLIGANNFHFADIVQTCVTDWLTSPSWWPDYCSDDSNVASNFTSSNIAAQTSAIAGAFANIRTAMSNAGYATSAYTIIVQTYSTPIPPGSGFRYAESGYTRQTTGGCGMWNHDADWANNTVVPDINGSVRNAIGQAGLTNSVVLDSANALVGRRLCENTVGLLEEEGLANWTSRGAVDKTEWVSQIRTTTTLYPPYQLQEDLHPSYWGQLGLRSCLRLAYNGGAPRGGSCTIAKKGLSTLGEPFMQLL